MVSLSYIDRYDYPEKSSTLQFADMCLTPLRVALGGVHVTSDNKISDAKTHYLAVRILAGLGALVLFPVTLGALAVKWCKYGEQPHFDPDYAEEEDSLEDEEEVKPSSSIDPDLTQDEFNQKLKDDLARVHHLDVKLGSPAAGSWRKYGEKCGEQNHTLDDYIEGTTYENPDYNIKKQEWPHKRPLVIQLIGSFDECNKKIIAITIDFLRQFHQIRIELEENAMTMEQLKNDYLKVAAEKAQPDNDIQEYIKDIIEPQLKNSFPRQNGQYDAHLALDMMPWALLSKTEEAANENCDLIAFTSEDLFAPQLQNFVFGCASLCERVGIWSNSRFGDPKASSAAFKTCLLRMMKISAHEFGHMRGLSHCTDYECNIGGYMSAQELDSRPLFYCLQDTAKICSLGQTSLLDYHKNLLKFFQKFNKKYGLHCDFSKEIGTLKGRIAVLENG